MRTLTRDPLAVALGWEAAWPAPPRASARGPLAVALGLLLALAGCAGPGSPGAASPADRLAPATPARTEAPAAPSPGAPAPGVAPSPGAAGQPAAPAVVKIGVTGTDPPHGVLVAAERGYFAEQGLAVEWGRIGVSAEVMRAVALGQVDVGSAATGPALSNLVTRGAQLWLVANTNQARAGNPSLCWVVRQDLWDSGEVRSIADLRGRLIAGQAQGTGSSNDIYLARTLQLAGLSEADVAVQALSFPEINAAMANKAIDVGWQLEPNMTLGIEQGLYQRLICLGDFLPDYQITYLSYSPEFRQRDVARGFMVAYLRGTRDYDDAFFKGQDKDAIIAILARVGALKDPRMWQRITPEWSNPDGTIRLEQLLADQDFYVRNGYLETRVDLAAVVDPQFVNHVATVLGPYR